MVVIGCRLRLTRRGLEMWYASVWGTQRGGFGVWMDKFVGLFWGCSDIRDHVCQKALPTI
jgi:hypothetical protein